MKTLSIPVKDMQIMTEYLDLWRQGIDERLFVPAFHGREHLSVTRWLKALAKW